MGKSKKKPSKVIQPSPIKNTAKDVHFSNVESNSNNQRNKE